MSYMLVAICKARSKKYVVDDRFDEIVVQAFVVLDLVHEGLIVKLPRFRRYSLDLV